MWWLMPFLPDLTILTVAMTTLPSQSISYGPVYNLIVLGIIPGTDIQINFMSSILLILVLALVLLLKIELKKNQQLSGN